MRLRLNWRLKVTKQAETHLKTIGTFSILGLVGLFFAMFPVVFAVVMLLLFCVLMYVGVYSAIERDW
jgi:hypothetical protein